MKDDRLAELLLQWEELTEQGREATAEEICRDCPELAGPLSRRIEALQAMGWMMADEQPPVLALADTGPIRTLAGRYRLDELVGQGGFAQVWKAYDTELQRTVAVKIPRPSRRFSPEEIERFVSEARKLARLRHPGVVAVHDICRSGAAFFIVTEWIEGGDLASRLLLGPVPPEQAVRLVAEVARTLAYAHSQGVVHRDIKPANVLIDTQGKPWLCDFGIAAFEQELLEQAAPLFTLAYASPEQVSGQPIDARTDIWSLGVILYELLAGRPPFEGENPGVLQDRLVSHEPPPLPATVPSRLKRICLKCLAKNPAERYATAQELADELLALPHGNGWRMRLLATAVVLAVVLSGVFVAATYWPRTSPTPHQPTTEAEAEGVPTVTALHSFEGHTGPVLSVVFSPDGKTVATGSADATVRLWPVDGGKGIVLPQVMGCTALAFTEGGKTLGCGCDNGTVRLWDLHGKEPKEGLVIPGHTGAITCVAFTPDGKFLATGGKDGTVRLLDRSAAKPQGATIPKAGGVVLSLRFSAGGDKLLVGYGDEGDKPAEFWVWQLRQPEGKPQLALHQRAPLVGLRDVQSMLISPEGNRILAATSGEVFVWERVEGKDSFRVMGSLQGPTPGVALSPDGRLALTCGDGGLRSWDVRSMKVLARFVGHEGAVNCVAFSPDGETVVSGGADGTVRIWRTRNRVANVTFKADGRDQAGGDAGHERRVAEWVLGLGGNLTAVTTKDGSVMGIERPGDLPYGSFQVVEVNLRSIKGRPDLAELHGLAELRRLRLADVAWGDAALDHLSRLEKLECLELGRAGITDEGMRHLKGMSGLRSLSIDTAAITNDGVRCLAGLSRLEILRLNRLKITDEALAHLSGLHSLQALELYETPITGAGCKHLAKLPNLNYLMLIGTQVGDTDVDDLALLQGLTTLRLERTGLTESGVQRLRQKLPKCTVTR